MEPAPPKEREPRRIDRSAGRPLRSPARIGVVARPALRRGIGEAAMEPAPGDLDAGPERGRAHLDVAARADAIVGTLRSFVDRLAEVVDALRDGAGEQGAGERLDALCACARPENARTQRHLGL